MDSTRLGGNRVTTYAATQAIMRASASLQNKRGIIADCALAVPRVAHLPIHYAIHLNVACNQKCIMCAPHGNHDKRLLPFADFVAFFEQVRGVAEHITLIGGETL